LKFDFYLPKYNLLIEFDGQQHYIPYRGNIIELEKTKFRDNIKTEYCENNIIKLLRIKYTKLNKLEQILEENIYEKK
jgi:very-short-patch-repair endonuclease